MEKRIYLDDWFINAGILGMKKVLERYADPTKYQIHRHYIQFDPSILKEFATYFFEVLIEKHSVLEQDRMQLEKYLEYARKPNQLVKYIKETNKRIKSQKDNLKKVECSAELINQLDQLLEGIKALETSPDYNQLHQYINDYLKILSDPEINDILTIRSVFSLLKKLFGQPSFLNTTFKGRKAADYIRKFHEDYIEPVLFECELQKLLQTLPPDQWIEELEKKKQDKSLSDRQEKVIKEINDQIEQSGRVLPCSIQLDWLGTEPFEEKIFYPLGLSLENNQNFIWNSSSKPFISQMTRLLLFCSSIAFVSYRKKLDQDMLYTHGLNIKSEQIDFFAFVNLDDSIQHLEYANTLLENKKDVDNPFRELVNDLLLSTQDMARYALENILFVEFNSKYKQKNTKLQYFHIPKKLAMYFLDDKLEIKKIQDQHFKYFLIEEILNRKDPIKFISNYLRKQISEEKSAWECLQALLARQRLKCYLRGEGMVNDKKLNCLYKEGKKIVEHLRNSNKENQLTGITYRLLNACKVGNKQLFMDIVLRLYMSLGRGIPDLFLNVLHEKDLEFEEVGYAFISGLQAKEGLSVQAEEEQYHG